MYVVSDSICNSTDKHGLMFLFMNRDILFIFETKNKSREYHRRKI